MEGGDGRCAGGVEVKHQGEWRRLGSCSSWTNETADVLCRQLQCGPAVFTAFSDEDQDRPTPRSRSQRPKSARKGCPPMERGNHSSGVQQVVCLGNTNKPLY